MLEIEEKQRSLAAHPIYRSFYNLENIRHFMSHHVFAVWDFMSLLKSLQQKITTVRVPWKPSPYPAEMVRLINQIVLGEESDLDQEGHPVSHFTLYLRAMEELGADTQPIHQFLKTDDFEWVPLGARDFVRHTLKTAQKGDAVEVAASFFYGREKLVPEMFDAIVNTLKREAVQAPTLLYYLERHIEVDSGEHGPLALRALNYLTSNDLARKQRALNSGLMALEQRLLLWEAVYQTLPGKSLK